MNPDAWEKPASQVHSNSDSLEGSALAGDRAGGVFCFGQVAWEAFFGSEPRASGPPGRRRGRQPWPARRLGAWGPLAAGAAVGGGARGGGPERELRKPEEEELGFTRRAFGGSASSPERKNTEDGCPGLQDCESSLWLWLPGG